MTTEQNVWSHKWRRGNYLAQVVGRHPKYKLDREFAHGRTVKGGGGWVNYTRLDIGPGFYESQEWRASEGKVRTYHRFDGVSFSPLPDSAIAILGEIAEGPAPGEPGEWGGPVCRCGADATDYSPAGWPYCAQCGAPDAVAHVTVTPEIEAVLA